MSTRELICQVLVCDGCGKDFEHEFTPHHSNVQDLRDESIDCYEWRTDGQDLDWCPKCQVCREDDHVRDSERKTTCARCDEILDEEIDQP